MKTFRSLLASSFLLAAASTLWGHNAQAQQANPTKSPTPNAETVNKAEAAKPALESDALFMMDKVWTVQLTLTPEAWKALEPPASAMPRPISPPGSRPLGERLTPGPTPQRFTMPEIDFPEVRATFAFDGKVIGDVGLRYKGNSSFFGARNSLKKSFKLDFNQYDKKLRFYGLTKLNLNNNFSDGSQMRESLSFEIFRQAGVPASRTSYAQVFVTVPGEHDKRYLGLYTIVEQVDDRYLQRTFGSKKGLLVKPELPQGLPYFGEDGKVYEKAYDAKENITPEDLQRLAAFVKLVNQANDAEFADQIRSFMDVKAFLRFLAVNSLLANGDSLLSMGHNYYIYLEPKESQFHWLPWDLNMSLGGFPLGSVTQQMELSLMHPHAGENKLIDRLLAIKEIKAALQEEYQDLLASVFQADKINLLIARLESALRPAIREESAAALQAFERALQTTMPTTSLDVVRPMPGSRPGTGSAGPGEGPARDRMAMIGGGGSIALKPFIAGRITSAQAQLAGKSEGYVPRRFGPGGGGPGGPGTIMIGPGSLLAEQMFPAMDTDADKKLSVTEVETAVTRWFREWAGEAVTLSHEKLTQGLGKFIKLPDGMPPPPMEGGLSGMLANSFLLATDSNKDQKLSLEEFKNAFASRYVSWDADQNKSLDQTEFGQGFSKLLMPPGLEPPWMRPVGPARSN